MNLNAESSDAVPLDRLDIRFMWREIYHQLDMYANYYRHDFYSKYLRVLMKMRDDNCLHTECKDLGLLLELKVLDDNPFNWYRNLHLKRTNVRLNANSLQELCTIKITSNIHHYDLGKTDVLHMLWTMFNKLPDLMKICFMAGPAEYRTLYHVKSVFVYYFFRYFYPDAIDVGFPRYINWDRIGMNPTVYCHACVDAVRQLNANARRRYNDILHGDMVCSLCSMLDICNIRAKMVELTGHLTSLQTTDSSPFKDHHCDSYTYYDPSDVKQYLKYCPFNGSTTSFSSDRYPYYQ